MERLYKYYITRHPSALQHLQNLPQTPALQNYLAYTRTVACSLSHAWDLASLLIKPVQRLLKYPLLLAAIIDETPDGHPDKEMLFTARLTMEEVARNVNEGRRRAEVVKDVLSSKSTKKPNSSVGVAASVNISKMKSIRHGGVTAATMRVSQLTEGNNEAAQVEALQAELKRIDTFAQDFAKSIVDWGKMTSNMMFALRIWSCSFGKVIGLSADQGSEAFDAFLEVVQRSLMPLATDLEVAINERVLKDLAHLLMTMTQPFKLVTSMNEQEPYHYHLLTMPVNAKNRPPPSLLAASTNYLALRGQLAAELPTYIKMLHKGLAILVCRLAELQMRFWRDVRDRWAELWDMLRVESELNVGWKETCAVWRTRWSDVDKCFGSLVVSRPVQEVFKKFMEEKEERERQYREMRVREVREARERKMEVIMKRDWETEKIMRGGLGSGPPSLNFPKNSSMLYPCSTSPSSSSSPYGGSSAGSTVHLTSPSKTSVATTKYSTVNSMISALEPAHSTSLSKTNKKDKPAVSIERAMLSSLSPAGIVGLSSYSTSMAMNNWMASSAKEKEKEKGKEVIRDGGKRGRAFSADAASALNVRRPSSQDGHVVGSIPSRPNTGDGEIGFRSQMPKLVKIGRYDDGTSRPSGTALSYKPELVRMQSMPLSMRTSELKATSVFADFDDATYDYYEKYLADRYTHSYHGPQLQQQQHQVKSAPVPPMEVRRSSTSKSKQRDSDGPPLKDRGRRPSKDKGDSASTGDMSQKRKSKDKEEKSKERPEQTRKRSGSIKSITSFFTNSHANASSSPTEPPQLTASQRDSWVSKPAKYICRVVHPCKPPASVSYYSFPFFMLQEGDLYEVLQEAGHPSIHPNLPLYVDDGEDCLLLCRDANGLVGWALASFLEPLSGS